MQFKRIIPIFYVINSSLQDSNTSESFNFGSLNGVRGFYTNPSRADDSFIPFKSDINNAMLKDFSSGTNTSMKSNITIPSDCNHCILLVIVSQGYNSSYMNDFSFDGDISNIKTIIETDKYSSSAAKQLLLYEFDTISNGNINLSYTSTRGFITFYTTLLY